MRVLVTLAAVGMALSSAASAQATFATLGQPVESYVVVGDSTPAAPGVGINNPLYLPPSADNNYSGVVNLWLDDLDLNQRFGCTGSLLSNRHILIAAHCVTTAGAVTTDRFTARFRNADGTFTAVTGTRIAVQVNYSGAVLEEQDVAVLTLDTDAPASARRYTLFQGNPLVDFTMAGFGRTGTGVTGGINNTANNQFGAVSVLRAGRNAFESTGRDGGSFATAANPNPGAFGGMLIADFDRIGVSAPSSFVCGGLAFCNAGLDLESSIGSGDSGGAAFTNTWQVLGVASWGTTTGGIGGLYGSSFGYACVSNYAPNAACTANYNFVMGVIPEPSTYALMVTGMIGLIGIARRRRAV